MSATQPRRGGRRLRSRKARRAANHVSKPALPCEKQPQKPTPPQAKPCDLDKVQIKCTHCASKRSEFKEGMFWVDQEKMQYFTNYPDANKAYFWAVTANSAASSEDEITLKITRAECHDPSEHPSIFITHPPEMVGKQVSYKGKIDLVFRVGYPKDWFKRNLEAAQQQSGLKAIAAFFFPAPVTYHILILSCGQRPTGQKVFRGLGNWRQQVMVYTDDLFKLSIRIPSGIKTESISSKGHVGDSQFHSTQGTQTTGFGHNVTSREEALYQTHGHTVLQQNDIVRDRRGGVRETQTLGETQTGTAEHNRVDGQKQTKSALGETARSFTFTHNGNDISNQLKLVAFFDKILQIRKLVLDLIDILRKIATALPKFAWSFSWTLDIFSGALELEWGWKEWKKDNTVFAYWKAKAAFTIISASVKVSFGVDILGAKAEVFGLIKVDVRLSTAVENTPEHTLQPTVLANFNPGGELGVSGALGDFVKLEGKFVAGLEGESKLGFMPFKWTLKASIAETKGVFTAKALWGAWQYEQEWTLLKRQPLMDEYQLA